MESTAIVKRFTTAGHAPTTDREFTAPHRSLDRSLIADSQPLRHYDIEVTKP